MVYSSGSDNSKTVYDREKIAHASDKKRVFLSDAWVTFLIFCIIVKILLTAVKKKRIIMVFGKVKKNGFCKQKGVDKNRQSPSYHKQRTILQPSVKRKRVAASHHHELRSPQKRTRMEAAVDLPCDVSPADADAEPFPVAEPLSTVELMPRELRTSKGASAQYVPVITARRLQPNEVPHDDFGTVNNKPL